VIAHSRFPAEPWHVRELGLDLDVLAQSESLFALSNGHIGLRGNFDEGEPYGLPGTYLNSFYESRPLPYAEAGYGYPESGQTIVNVTNGKVIRLLVDDEPFDMRYGETRHHERVLDLRGGRLRRVVEWISPAGQRIRLRTTRLVSFTQRSIVAIRYEVEVMGEPARIVVQSELVANEHVPEQHGDPRVAAILASPLEAEEHAGSGTRALLMHRTRSSKLRMAASMEHVIACDSDHAGELEVNEDWARLTVSTRLEPGKRLTLTKFVAYGWSSQRSVPALRDQVGAALASAVRPGWDQLVADQRKVLDEYWAGADIQIDGDPAVQQAVRFGMFHTFQASVRAEQRAIAAKGLTGPGYDGHAFWDTESFVLPVLTATVPHAAADALRWRWSTLDLARQRAETIRARGASFPWRTIRGHECSGYWPAGTAAVHINADIAVAAIRYVDWTGDAPFERDFALPVLVETARLWRSIGFFDEVDGQFHFDGVTGPDEYSAIVDDNIYTNLMARLNLQGAADAADRWPDEAAGMQVTAEEVQSWRAAAAAVAIPYDAIRQVHKQDVDFTDHETWDFEETARTGAYPLLLNAPYFEIYRKQVIKQADLILAMHWCGDMFTLEEKARAYAYYEPLTVRDSSLSACTQAVLGAEVGQVELASEYLAEAAFMDLHDLAHNSRDGLHIASLAGTWLAVVAGFGGMRDHGGRLSFHPQLAPGWRRFSFGVRWHDVRIRVTVDDSEVTYEVADGADDDERQIELVHCGEPFTLRCGESAVRPVEHIKPVTSRPSQPPGRAPLDIASLP
jgi:alpha,alpha-trehalose phosphorylase